MREGRAGHGGDVRQPVREHARAPRPDREPGDLTRVLVTGGSGFIGRNFVERLSDRFEVLAPPRAEMDLRNEASVRRYVREHPVDAAVHAATVPGHRNAPPAPDLALGNLRMHANLVEALPTGTRLVVLGSGAEYDTRRSLVRVREEELGNPIPEDQTGFSKYLQSRLDMRRPNTVHLRPFGVFGKHEDWEIRFLSNAACKAIFGRPITLRQDRSFDYLFVDDLVEVVAHVLTHEMRFADYNVTPDASSELRALAELVRAVADADVPIHVARPGAGPAYSGDNARLQAELPFAFTPMREAVERLVAWYRENRALIREEALGVDK